MRSHVFLPHRMVPGCLTHRDVTMVTVGVSDRPGISGCGKLVPLRSESRSKLSGSCGRSHREIKQHNSPCDTGITQCYA